MAVLPLAAARAAVIAETRALGALPAAPIDLDEARGRVLAEPVFADRDQPPFDRSTRDGFAVRAADVAGAAEAAPVTLAVLGEVPAGRSFPGVVGPGQCVEIKTGAPVPSGADAVVMVEHTTRPPGETGRVAIGRVVQSGENIVPTGSELARGAEAFPAGRRLDAAAIALLASLGCARPRVHARPRVAILSTGDEIVPLGTVPDAVQIRDSNRHALAALVRRAGGEPVVLPIARDDRAALTALLTRAVAEGDLVLVTGGVSAGRHDHVEEVLATLGARIVFDGVQIRPGRPLVFGLLQDKPFFGLPGNPLSAMVTFELFARAALDLRGGIAEPAPLPLLQAQLRVDYAQRPVPLTVFVPAAVEPGPAPAGIRPLASQGSGDLAALARADAFMVVEPGVTTLAAGAWVSVLPK